MNFESKIQGRLKPTWPISASDPEEYRNVVLFCNAGHPARVLKNLFDWIC